VDSSALCPEPKNKIPTTTAANRFGKATNEIGEKFGVHQSTAMFDWIDAFHNPTRRHSAFGNISPVGFERRHTNTTTAA
jgi:hypothetical protein